MICIIMLQVLLVQFFFKRSVKSRNLNGVNNDAENIEPITLCANCKRRVALTRHQPLSNIFNQYLKLINIRLLNKFVRLLVLRFLRISKVCTIENVLHFRTVYYIIRLQ